MKIRPFYSISILAIVLGLCAIGWIVFQPKQMGTHRHVQSHYT